MDKVRVFQALIYFKIGERIAHDFLKGKGFSDIEIQELLKEKFIIPAGKNNAGDVVYVITDIGKRARD